jgi:hypothetical protein
LLDFSFQAEKTLELLDRRQCGIFSKSSLSLSDFHSAENKFCTPGDGSCAEFICLGSGGKSIKCKSRRRWLAAWRRERIHSPEQEGWRPRGTGALACASLPSAPRRAPPSGCALPRLDSRRDRHFDKSAPLCARQLGPARYAALCQVGIADTRTQFVYLHSMHT